jgi:hypothetical protein
MLRTPVQIATAVAFCVAATLGAGAALAQGDDAAAIRDLFDRYKSALLTGDGATASRLVDAETFAYFEDIKRLTLSGGEEEVRSRPFVDRLLIVTMRHELEPAKLEGMDLEGLLRHAIDAGWIGKQSIAQLGMGEVTVDGDEATAIAITPSQGTTTPAAGDGLRYRFVRESSEWRFGFRSLVESINEMISQLTKQMGTDQDALIFLLVEQLSGRKVLPEIWSLPGGSGAPQSPVPPPAVSDPAPASP